MTRAQLYTFVTSLLDGTELDDVLFNTLLNTAKQFREEKRDWMVLRKQDSSKTANPSDTFETAKALPTDFSRTFPVLRANGVLASMTLRTGDSIRHYTEIPFGTQQERKDDYGNFYIDHNGGNFYLTGTVDQAYTIYLNYIYRTDDASLDDADDTWTWGAFPSRYSRILAFDIAAMQKGEIDYDDIHARMSPEHKTTAAALEDAMEMWDDALQRASLESLE